MRQAKLQIEGEVQQEIKRQQGELLEEEKEPGEEDQVEGQQQVELSVKAQQINAQLEESEPGAAPIQVEGQQKNKQPEEGKPEEKTGVAKQLSASMSVLTPSPSSLPSLWPVVPDHVPGEKGNQENLQWPEAPSHAPGEKGKKEKNKKIVLSM
jgi:hypothetical protein